MSEKIDQRLAISEEEGKILMDLVSELKPSFSLEVGTGHGVSTHFIADGMNNKGTFYSLDINSRPIIKDLVENVVLSNMSLEAFISKAPDYLHFDFVFLDSNHQIDSIIEDIERIVPFLSEKGIIVVHDTNFLPEMGICLRDYFEGNDSERLKMVGVKPSNIKWIYENKNTEFGLGIAKRGEK